jgi:hypothetical protein
VEQRLEMVDRQSSLSPWADGPRFEWVSFNAVQCDECLTTLSQMSMVGRRKGFPQPQLFLTV